MKKIIRIVSKPIRVDVKEIKIGKKASYFTYEAKSYEAEDLTGDMEDIMWKILDNWHYYMNLRGKDVNKKADKTVERYIKLFTVEEVEDEKT